MLLAQKVRFALFALLFLNLPLIAEQRPPRDREFVCRFATGPITLDGVGNEEAWKDAELIDAFYKPWDKENFKARSATKARLLWDREYLYFLAEMEDTDLYADVTEHDGMTWDNDVFELFFKPADDKPGYYEHQVNAAGTVMDMFLPRRNAGGYKRFIADGEFHIEAKVSLKGTLNKWQDKDEGWSVEGRIPWRDFSRTGGRPEVLEKWKFALCRYDYSVDFEGPDLVTCAPLDSKPHPDFHHFEDYAVLKFEGPTKLGAVEKANPAAAFLAELKQHSTRVKHHVVGSPEPPLPYRTRRVMPELKPSFPIFVEVEPGTRRLMFIDQKWSYGPARIARTTEKPGELETLLEFPEAGVGYTLAFHPQYLQNGYLYVGWNGAVAVPSEKQPTGAEKPDEAEKKEKRSIITRYTIDRKTHQLLPDSALEIISWASDGHNGAAIVFGHDGMLYITSGDGTSDSDTNIAGQELDTLLSKLLRIDVDHPDAGRAYSVPKDNPFVGQEKFRPETYAYGFRNPWRITADAQTGAIWVGQNGQDLWEQVYLVQPGANYGWSVYEGSHLFYPERKLGPQKLTLPTVEHPHSEARSLTGGVVYYGKQLPELRGAYIYGDYSTGKIWGVKVKEGKVVWQREIADTPFALTCFALDTEGELLITDHRGNNEGGLYTLEPNPPNDSAGKFPRTLSATGLFTSVAGHKVDPGLIPYDVNAPLWSDGAYKERYLYLPATLEENSEPKLTPFDLTNDDRGWNLPEGAIVVKSFALDTPQGRRWVETRLMVKEQGEWVGYSYAWNEEQTEATLVELAGADRTFATKQGELAWHFPSRTECMVCHSRAANYVLGLNTSQFNRSHNYGGTSLNQLELLEWLGALKVNWGNENRTVWREALQAAGKTESEANAEIDRATNTRDQREAKTSSLLRAAGESYPKLVDPYDTQADLTARVKSYLHSNCAQCHVEAGGGNSQMQLAWTTPLEKMKIVNEKPLHSKFETAEARLISPGHAEQSILLHRMAIRGRGQMPQLATNRVDEQAVSLLREWIASLGTTEK